MHITEMDYFRAGIYNAEASGLTLQDVAEMIKHAKTAQEFDQAVNMLGLATLIEEQEGDTCPLT